MWFMEQQSAALQLKLMLVPLLTTVISDSQLGAARDGILTSPFRPIICRSRSRILLWIPDHPQLESRQSFVRTRSLVRNLVSCGG